MIRFITKFKCKECGHTFIGADVEDNATAASMPVKCPKCGSYNTDANILGGCWEKLKETLYSIFDL